MQNKFPFLVLVIFLSNLFISNLFADNEFSFDISEVEILEDGNKVVGKKRGKITSENGIIISSDEFEYDKLKNIIIATGNVIIEDNPNDVILFSNKVIYKKNLENFFSAGKTTSTIYSRYNLTSDDLNYNSKSRIIKSEKKTLLNDTKNKIFYEASRFNFHIDTEILKGEDVFVNTDYDLPQSDKYYFQNGIFNLIDRSFLTKDVKVYVKKDIFSDLDNDPRIEGVSGTRKNEVTEINKGVFTSCKKTDKCPPWVIEAEKIKHDKNKKTLTYKNAWLKIYDVPVLYFPHFFHPDPSVDRQSGLLKPEFNNSNILGSSFGIPYFHVISLSKDITVKPVLFEKEMQMIQSEYRQVNKNSTLFADFGFVNGYKSSISKNKNSLSHLFAKFYSNLNLDNFRKSELNLKIEKSSNDTYLKIFDANITENEVTPENFGVLNSQVELKLINDDINFTSGMHSYENLSVKSSDRYQFIFPYYDLEKGLFPKFEKGYITFNSSGSNELINTNNLKTKIINDLKYQSLDLFTDNGLKNNFNFYLKNLNTVAKNDSKYRSSPQTELMSTIELTSSMPLINNLEKNTNYLTPKLSLRFNPGDMKNYSADDRTINVDNIFNINRLGINDSFEEGKSLTLGIDYKKENLSDINRYFEAKIATVLRDENEKFIPTKTTINNKSSNIFGSISNKYYDFLDIEYDFALNNNFDRFEFNSINLNLNFENLTSEFYFIEESGVMGNANAIENSTSYEIDKQNFLTFSTRRNREIKLTEYYNLIYEYKNDCLTAGIKYNKTYYQDRDVKPSENLLFTVTLYPLTTFERKVGVLGQ